MTKLDSKADSKADSKGTEAASASAKASRRLDVLGTVAFLLYVVAGGVLVFGFGGSLESAVQTQNETSCRALQPAHAQVRGHVLDTAGDPAAGAEVVPVIDGRSGIPTKVDPADGSFQVLLPKGAQALRVRAPGKEGLEAGLVLGRSEVVDVRVVLADEGKSGGTLEEQGRAPYDVPDFTVRDLSGQEVSLSDFRGKLVVLNFWATYCEPCITEWPQLAKLAERLAEQRDVVVLAISIDEDQAPIEPFLQQMSLADTPVRVLWDPTTTLHTQLGSEKIPDTYFIDEKGRVSSVFVSTREWGSPSALHCVESSLGR
ncbi:MAG: redoxin domain-containing protein [Myxococcales bacterium]|nr:redoxin domain-containing protein [Myxococcales bacterium]